MTKQLNKKGTSLVELIAVIVIMGIIAGIAIPTTIAVINRQKKNAATKSIDSVISTMKNVLLEAQASATATTITGTATYAAANTTPTSFSVYNGTTTTDTIAGFTPADMNVDNLKAVGTVTVTLDINTGKFSFGAADQTIESNGITVTINHETGKTSA